MTRTIETAQPPVAVESIPVQPRGSFVCPSWCVLTHTEADLYPWEYGQWTVRHVGETHTWVTSRDTEMSAELVWTEIVGSSPILVGDAAYDAWGPYIELGGSDGSGSMGTNEIVASDLAEWFRVLMMLAAEVKS